MSITLTPELQQAIDASPEHLLRLTDPRTSATYILMPADQFECVRDILDDEQLQKAVGQVALRNAAARAGEEP